MLRLRNTYLQSGRVSIYPIRSQTPSKFIPIHLQNRDHSSQSSGRSDENEEHAIKRAERGEKEDPAAAAVASGIEERRRNEGIADDTKSGATTERGGSKHAAKAKKEHPAAPEPIIGMNDERAKVSFLLLCPSLRSLALT